MWDYGDPEGMKYAPPRMTDTQMRALRETIIRSKNATPLAKQAILWLLAHTENLTQRVALSIPNSMHNQLAEEMRDGAHDMNSCNGSTYLQTFMHGMGTEVTLVQTGNRFDRRRKETSGWTIMWTCFYGDHDAKEIQPDLAQILALKLEREAA